MINSQFLWTTMAVFLAATLLGHGAEHFFGMDSEKVAKWCLGLAFVYALGEYIELKEKSKGRKIPW